MKTRFLKLVFFMALSAGMFSSCVNDDDYSVPAMECNDPDLTVTKTVEEIFNQATGSAVLYEADDIIEAVVVSSDRGGNFYKKIYLNSVDGERGFSVAINQADLFTDYNVGRKVYIKLKGLYTQIRHNTLEIGALYNGNVGQIAANIYTQHIKRSCTSIPEENLVKHLTLADVNDSNLGKLVEFDNVQFASSSLGQNYYNPSNVLGGETNHIIEDINGNNLIFRTGQYAEYAGLPVSANSGKIRGVLTKFNTTYQFVARYTTDIQLANDHRLGEEPEPNPNPNPNPNPGDSETAIGGTDIQYLSSFVEDFESYATPSVINYNPGQYTTFDKYVNDAVSGPRYWAITQFQGNKYIQMSAHNTNSNCRVYFAMPANLTDATLSFKTKDGYYNGDVLKVYYSTDYVAGTSLDEATLVDITSNFTIASGSTSGYATNYTSSGSYNIPATGNGFIIFEYTGTHPAGPTTTMQLDDITIE